MSTVDVTRLRQELHCVANPKKAEINAWFFKTGPGQYGEGDTFIGVTVPQLRVIAKHFSQISLADISELLQSPIHEERLISLIILVNQYTKATVEKQKQIYHFYLSNSKKINNWDLVDTSAAAIVGHYLQNKNINILEQLAVSDNVWERRISMISTFYFIKQQRYHEAFQIADIPINDQHDLIQKAVGWMLREVGKKCGLEVEEAYLLKHYRTMPHTMLRYAIEHFPVEKKTFFMKKS